MEKQELTFGQKAMGVSFSPSKNPEIDRIKEKYAEIADILNDFRNDKNPSLSSENRRLASVAITELQASKLWAIVAITHVD